MNLRLSSKGVVPHCYYFNKTYFTLPNCFTQHGYTTKVVIQWPLPFGFGMVFSLKCFCPSMCEIIERELSMYKSIRKFSFIITIIKNALRKQ